MPETKNRSSFIVIPEPPYRVIVASSTATLVKGVPNEGKSKNVFHSATLVKLATYSCAPSTLPNSRVKPVSKLPPAPTPVPAAATAGGATGVFLTASCRA